MTKYTIKKENNNILYNYTQSNPISSKNKMSELDIYRNAVKENIEYDILVEKEPLHKDMIDEIVELMAETLNSKREEITIASDTHSMADVRKNLQILTANTLSTS